MRHLGSFPPLPPPTPGVLTARMATAQGFVHASEKRGRSADRVGVGDSGAHMTPGLLTGFYATQMRGVALRARRLIYMRLPNSGGYVSRICAFPRVCG